MKQTKVYEGFIKWPNFAITRKSIIWIVCNFFDVKNIMAPWLGYFSSLRNLVNMEQLRHDLGRCPIQLVPIKQESPHDFFFVSRHTKCKNSSMETGTRKSRKDCIASVGPTNAFTRIVANSSLSCCRTLRGKQTIFGKQECCNARVFEVLWRNGHSCCNKSISYFLARQFVVKPRVNGNQTAQHLETNLRPQGQLTMPYFPCQKQTANRASQVPASPTA